MSFFSGFLISRNFGRKYESSRSEAMATVSNTTIAAVSLFYILGNLKGNKKKLIFVIILFILSILALVLYYIQKNEIIKEYVEGADENLNKTYFTCSMVGATLTIIILNIFFL